ncbi:MAG TPA: SDR family oxidoreductase [Gammaproteobacteria bacterium]|jgi:NAD(P)-dependent dehydrogenase (short-subunit alcohol dehydrogenase family)|nr:short-chain dehydrogenase [Gammaproteobacteria bacterium]HIA58669.1 SDR family oxidoreductase [Gammaproteobacteria bacterium]HIF86327.1 SDR family oxidoreductase [Gammaproteobacteria bacterium]HIL63088.1 SDR family oxidoreductase [Porticoccaceae bacterium]HIN90898.1 SDR family oxidoreductase [Porticoccaceae bacterium]|tara:strand:+ start:34814 stop:35608 length:795 start_codon:yes stop_codon:yes gene_type:complete
MQIKGKVVVVTGGASGIGKSLCERFAQEGASAVVVSDINQAGIDQTVADISASTQALGVKTDVGNEEEVNELVAKSLDQFDHIDLFCSNAGIFTAGGENVSTEAWQSIWDINVMSHIFAARAVLPGMLARGEGYLLNTSSAAGLLSQVGSAPYAVTKHAAVGFAEWLSISYGNKGIKVSVLCPQAVRTAMTAGGDGGVAGLDGMLEPEKLADTVIETLDQERFLVLPHPEVLTYMRRKTDDYDRWLGGMRRLHEKFEDIYKKRE